jgi:hypothetical protein
MTTPITPTCPTCGDTAEFCERFAIVETTAQLAWILNITREWHRDLLSASEVQERMDAKFPAIEHRAIWSRLIDALR